MKHGCEIELGNETRRIFMKVDFDPFRIWIDTEGLPHEALLCAMHDGTDIIQAECGDEGNIKRFFIDIEWAINEWGGDEELVNALKNRRQMTIDDLPRLKEKYGYSFSGVL